LKNGVSRFRSTSVGEKSSVFTPAGVSYCRTKSRFRMWMSGVSRLDIA
jgi:hypothetical protein